MKKKFLTLLVLVMAAVMITACGKSKDKTASDAKDGEEEQEEEIEKYNFVIWGRVGDLSEENGNWLKTRCDMFATKYPDAEVTFEFAQYSPEEAMKAMEENREEAPDIYIFNSSQVDELVEDRLLTRLWGETEEYVLESNAQEISNLATYQEKVYGLPVSATPYVLYYDNAVYTPEDVANLETLLQKGRLAYPLNDQQYIAAFGDVDEAFLKSLKRNDNLLSTEDEAQGITYLQEGKVNAIVGDSNSYQQVQAVLGERMGVAALPTFTINGETRQMNRIKEIQIVGVNPDCEEFEMSIALATYLGSADAQQMHYDMSGAIPVNINVINTLKEEPLIQIVGQVTTVEDLQRIQEALEEEEKAKEEKK